MSPEAVNLLFSKDPLDLSDTEIAQMAAFLRSQRAQFAQAEATAIAEGKKVKGPKAIPGPKIKVSLDDLELDL